MEAFAVTKPLESMSPTIKGGKDWLMMAYQGVFFSLPSNRLKPIESAAVGKTVESVATIMPAKPATLQPTKLISSTLGPGATWEMANAVAKSASSIQE